MRPRKCRRLSCNPSASYFKPRGIPLWNLEEVVLTFDEVEALRLVDMGGIHQQEAAERMNISQPTLHRMLEGARRKVAQGLTERKAIRIEGGDFVVETGIHGKGKDECGEGV